MEIVLSTMIDSHSDLATAITAVTMPQRMCSLNLVAAAVKSHAQASDASNGCAFAPYRPPRDSKNPVGSVLPVSPTPSPGSARAHEARMSGPGD
jgi:hypothetical protein